MAELKPGTLCLILPRKDTLPEYIGRACVFLGDASPTISEYLIYGFVDAIIEIDDRELLAVKKQLLPIPPEDKDVSNEQTNRNLPRELC